MPLSADLLHKIQSGAQAPTSSHRPEKLLGTNCAHIELLSFTEDGVTYRVISKKSRLDNRHLETLEKEYQSARHHL
jgi:hypothetical protein